MIIGNPLLLKKAADSTPADPVTRSLRFNKGDNSALYIEPTVDHDSATVFTFSCWAKLSEMGVASSYTIFSAGEYPDATNQVHLHLSFMAAGTLRVGLRSQAATTTSNHYSTAVFRDPSAWYHILMVRDGASLKVYVNNSVVINETISSTTDYGVGSGRPMHVGSNLKHTQSSIASYYSFDGLLADVYFTDGYAKSPTDFIEDAGYGAYKPKAYTGEFGTNGFRIDAQPAHDADLLVSSVGRNDGDTTFVDVAAGHTITDTGDPEHSIAVGNPFTGDGRAIYFDGSDDYLTVDDGTNIDLGTGDFTIEFWMNSDEETNGDYAMGRWNATPNVGSVSNREWGIVLSSSGGYGINIYTTAGTNYGTVDTCDSKWHHVAIVRSSGDAKCYLDGKYVIEATSMDSLNMSFSSKLMIGGGQTRYWRGAMYDYRISDTARYSSDFDVPTEKFTSDSNTLLLIQPHKDDTTFHDESSSPATVTTASSPTRTASTPFDAAAKSTAMYFDGIGDYLNIGTTSDFRTTTNNFTLDFWFKPNGSSTGTVFSNVNDGNVYDGLTANVSSATVSVSLRDSQPSNNAVSLNYTNDDTDWHHVEVSRTGSTLYLFVDGNLEDSGSISFTPTNSGLVARAGRVYANTYSGNNNYAGYLFDYRWSNSGGHTASFTAPTAPLELNPVYIGGDQSGNKNHFTPSGISITHDLLLDVPTKNYCLINPLAETKTDSTSYDANPTTGLSEGNLKLTSSALFFNGHGTLGVSSGKWYFEWYSTGDWTQGGFTTDEMYSNKEQSLTDFWILYNRDSSNSIAAYYKDGTSVSSASWAGGSHASGNGNVFGCAFDVDNRKMYFHKNGEWSDGTSTLTSTFPSAYGGDLTGSSHNIPADTTFFPTVRPWTNSTVIANFGQDSTFANTVASGSANAADTNGNGDFRYTPPSGYLALCTANLDAPSVTPSENFGIALYNGTSSSNSITGLGFQPDLLWTKSRSTSGTSHKVYDSARGVTKKLEADNTTAEGTVSSDLTSFDSDGFTLGSGNGSNYSGRTYVAWNWKAHQSPSTGARTSYTVKVEDNSGDGWDANTSFVDSNNFPTLYMELFENQTSGLVSLGKVAVRSMDDDGNSTSDQSEQTYILKCIDLDAIAVKWYYDTSGDGQESDYPNSYNDYLNEQKITILEGTSSTSGTWVHPSTGADTTGLSGTNNYSNDDGGTDYNYSPPTGWANGDPLKSATTSYTGSDTATLVSSEPVEKYNAAAGFSIISYAGNKSADGSADGETQEITHSLGAEPELIITKSRASGSYDSGYWEVYHKHTVMHSSHTDNSIHPQLWLNNAWDSYQGYYSPVIPKSGSENTIIEVTNDSGYGHYANESQLDYIMYAWTPVEGYSKFGSFAGNGSSDGPMVYTGFRPKYLMIKNTTSSNQYGWFILDSAREPDNDMSDYLYANTSDDEDTAASNKVDFLSSGFKMRGSGNVTNQNNGTMVYIAFAESPFKYANAK